MSENNTPRKLSDIASEILADWLSIQYCAIPYVQAMQKLNSIDDRFGLDSGYEIVGYFLANASKWRGFKAREIKRELNLMLKS